MGRKGDIVSKVIGVRAPIKVYTKLLNEASDKGISLSEYCVTLLSKNNFSQGGRPIISVPTQDPALIKEINKLKDMVTEHGNFLLKILHIEEVKKELEKSSLESVTFHPENLKIYSNRK
jgi:hypothetical protein